MSHPCPFRPPSRDIAVRRMPWALAACGAAALLLASQARAVDTLPVLWQAGGLSAGNDSAGQAARVTSDPAGNVSVVSGPSGGRDLAVTSYTASGALRWRQSVSPATGTFVGDWIAAAPNGDVVAVGRSISGSSGNPLEITLMRVAADGTLQWRVDLQRGLPDVGRLLVDAAGNAYLAFNSLGDGQDIQVHSYDPGGGLRWSRVIATDPLSNDIATSLALSPDETDIAVTGSVRGGALWITALYDTASGTQKWLMTAPEGVAALDAAVDAGHVYVTGQGNTGITSQLTVVARDRVTGERRWRTDAIPADGSGAAGLRMALSPDGSLAVAGQASRGFLDWYAVALETTGALRWEAVRDGGLNQDEVPAGVLVMPDGTVVVTGKGGPNLPGGFVGGVTAGYTPGGVLTWEAFSPFVTTGVTDLPGGEVCATGGYDAYVACFLSSPAGRVGTPGGDAAGEPPLRVARNADESLALTWTPSCLPTDTDYSVFEGALGAFGSPAPVACSTGGLTAATVASVPGDRFYLVAARNAEYQGSLGTDSDGRERSAGPTPCLPTAPVVGCR